MHNIRSIKENIYWVGTNDRRLELFENMYPIPDGVSYNSFLITDEKTLLMDTVDNSTRNAYLENIQQILNGRKLDYLVVNHMEPDHCGIIPDIIALYPDLEVVCNNKALEYMKAFYPWAKEAKHKEISDGSILSTGEFTFHFHSMPMVHWPEVMAVYETKTKTLFSSDAFGTFGTLNGNIFNDEIDFERNRLDDARRYYSNIVGKYGPQVQAVLKKLSGLEIHCIAPLHGPIWRNNIPYILDKYQKWSSYTPEQKGVVIIFGSMYSNTEEAANILATKLAAKGVLDIAIYDVSKTHDSYLIASLWKYSHVIFAAPTYNMNLYPNMKSFLMKLEFVGFQNRHIGFIGNYSWGDFALNVMKEMCTRFPKMTIVNGSFSIKSSVQKEDIVKIDKLANNIVQSLQGGVSV